MSAEKNKEICGVVMPISTIDGCTEGHWAEVLEVVSSAIENAGFDANLVSNADEVGIIHKRIIQNLYENPIVVCDVSAKNPNVMFELGLRLAFDKPTIIIKDDKTSYSFDTSAIEHLEYPRDLRFSKIVEFKDKLTAKITATYARSQSDGDYTTFLKHFGEFKVAKIEKKEVSGQEYILEELRSLRQEVRRSERARYVPDEKYIKELSGVPRRHLFEFIFQNEVGVSSFIKAVEKLPQVKEVDINIADDDSRLIKLAVLLTYEERRIFQDKLAAIYEGIKKK